MSVNQFLIPFYPEFLACSAHDGSVCLLEVHSVSASLLHNELHLVICTTAHFNTPPSGTALAFSHTLISMLPVDPLVHDVCVAQTSWESFQKHIGAYLFCHLLDGTAGFMVRCSESCDEETTLNTWIKHIHTKHGDNFSPHWLNSLNNKGLIKLFSGINCVTLV